MQGALQTRGAQFGCTELAWQLQELQKNLEIGVSHHRVPALEPTQQ